MENPRNTRSPEAALEARGNGFNKFEKTFAKLAPIRG
jgi:hypothetical protein